VFYWFYRVCVCVPFIFNCLLGANPDDFIPAMEQQNIVLEVHAFGTWNGTDEPSYNGAVIISGDEKVCGSPVREFEQRYEYNNTMSMWFRKAIWSIVYDTVLLENHLHAYYTYTWKCNNERPYIGILNKQKCLLKKQWWLERQNTCWLRVGTSGSGEDIRKSCRRINMVEILSINGKWELLKLFQEWGGEGEKGEQWRGFIQLWYILRTFINVTMYPQYNNNKNGFLKKLKSYIFRKNLDNNYT
jgi:hypothetical protein